MEDTVSQKPPAQNGGSWKRRLVLATGAAILFLALTLAYLTYLFFSLTSAAPEPVLISSLPRNETDALEYRVHAFQQALRQQVPTPPLVLTTAEMNTLVLTHPGLKAARGRVRLNLDGPFPEAHVSFQLKELQVPMFGGRYFNGIIQFTVRSENTNLHIYTREIRTKGGRVPSFLMALISSRNLADRINEDARFALTLENIESVTAGNGTLTITPRALQP